MTAGSLLGNGAADLQAAVELVQENNPYYGDSDEETEYVFADATPNDAAAVVANVENEAGDVATTENLAVNFYLIVCVHFFFVWDICMR